MKAAGPVTISTAFGDADDQVRRLAAQAAVAAEPLQTKFVERAIRDVSPTVRTAVLLALDRRQDASTCGYASLVLRDPDPHVALTAIDVAGRACAGNSAAIASLGALATRLPPPELPDVSTPATESPRDTRAGFPSGPRFAAPPGDVAAGGARVGRPRPSCAGPGARAPGTIRGRFAMAGAHVRRARGRLAKAADILEKLAADEHDNVRDAAVEGLRAARGHEADDVFLAALGRRTISS